MPPSPRSLVLEDFPSSPSSAWSFRSGSPSPSSATQDHPSPLTPDSCFPHAPSIATTDEFTFQIDSRLDKMTQRSSHIFPVIRLLPQSSVPSPVIDILSEDDTNEAQLLLLNTNSLPNRPCSIPCAPSSEDNASDDFSWEAAAHSPHTDTNELPDPLRCSLLIHEVSLLVGLVADDDHSLPGDGGSPLSKRVPDILPPTKSLASRKHKDFSIPYPSDSSSTSVRSSSSLPADNAIPNLHFERPPPVRSVDTATPISRHRDVYPIRPSLSPHRRQGQVFLPPPRDSRRHAVHLDEAFTRPREPPPKPTPTPTSNRCSSLDRLERSLLKLEAHAPPKHRKSQSEGQPSDHVVQRKDRCPSLPPPRRLKKQQPKPHPAYACQVSSPLSSSKSVPFEEFAAPRICPAIVPLDSVHPKPDITPGSFMDMDIPNVEALPKPRASFSSKTLKNLVSVARRVSRMIGWRKVQRDQVPGLQ